MDGSHGGFNSGGGGGRDKKTVSESEDLLEDEVWAMMKAREDSSSSSSACRLNATADGGGHPEFSATERVARGQSSSPVDIPDWSRILKKRSKKKLWDDDACDAHNDDDGYGHDKVDEVESDDDGKMVPPHEYLARRLGSTQIASFSMREGVGRTLKGRDLSKLRNAILTKTGFIE